MKLDELGFAPMTEADLAWVVENERVLHAFPWSLGNFQDCLKAGYGAWIMKQAGEPVAYAVMMSVVDEAHLLNISVVRQAQGTGCGSVMLQYLCGVARKLGANQFFLEVRPSNDAAKRLYLRHEFAQVGLRKRYYPAADGGREDAIVMKRDL